MIIKRPCPNMYSDIGWFVSTIEQFISAPKIKIVRGGDNSGSREGLFGIDLTILPSCRTLAAC